MIWFTSDLHFGHEAVIKYCGRPFFSVGHMNDTLIKEWNKCVKIDDEIFVLGDLALCPYSEFEQIAFKLNGKKYLIKGNHDHYSDSQYRRSGFTVFHEIKMKLCGRDARLSHYPYTLPWYKRLTAFKSELRFMDRRPPKIKGEFLLHGHVHTSYKRRDNRIHVGVDAWGYRPCSIREIESLMGKK